MDYSISINSKNVIDMKRLVDLISTLDVEPDVPAKLEPEPPPVVTPKPSPPREDSGWTEWPLVHGAKRIFVSAQGDDSADGLSKDKSVKTISAGIALLHDGKGDQLLLKRGDVFAGQDFGEWTKAGKSATAMLLIGAYGSGARPIVQPSIGSQILVTREGTACSYVAISDLHFLVDDSHDGSVRPPHIVWRAAGTHLHVEGCLFDGTVLIAQRIDGHAAVKNITFRRNVVDSPFAVGGRVHMFWQAIDGGLIEENFFYHVGWRDPDVPADMYTHSCYITHDCAGITFCRNIVMASSSHGVQLRCGGVITENVFIANPLHCSFGFVLGGSKDHPARDSGVSGIIRDNLFIDPTKINGADRGTGVQIGNVNGDGLQISGNLFLDDVRSGIYNSVAIEMHADNGPAGLNNIAIFGNVISNWQGGVVVQPGNYDQVSNIDVSNNALQRMRGAGSMPTFVSILSSEWEDKFSFSGNVYCKAEGETEIGFRVGDRTRAGDQTLTWWRANVETSARDAVIDYPGAATTISTYSESVDGGGTDLAFVARCRLQQRTFYDHNYTAVRVLNYFRIGYCLPALRE